MTERYGEPSPLSLESGPPFREALRPEAAAARCWYCGRPPGPDGLCDSCRTCDAIRVAEECEARRQATAEALEAVRADLPGALGRCGVPVRWRPASFDLCRDLPATLIEDVRTWATKPKGILYLYGLPGSGKTWAAVSAVRDVLASGLLRPQDCRFIDEQDFLAGLKAAFGKRCDLTLAWAPPPDASLRFRLLVFDDLAATRLSDWARAEVGGLLEYRHKHDLPTLVTSNVDPDGLAEAVDGRVSSRIAEHRRMLHFPAKDLRISGTVHPLLATVEGRAP